MFTQCSCNTVPARAEPPCHALPAQALPMHILLIEDEAELAATLKSALQRERYVVDLANTLALAREAALCGSHDLVLLDRTLPDGDGLGLISLLRERNPGVPIIVLSALGQLPDRIAGLDEGADDYLTKPFDTEELLARIRTAMRHRTPDQEMERVIETGEVRIDLAHRRVERAGEHVHLTPKEYGVLAELSRRPDRVVSHTQLLRAVWGAAQEDRVDYLRIAVRGLRQKLEKDASQPRLIINELAVGYRLRVRSPEERP